jgi:AcrR family transcriptional regulator
VTTTVSPTRRDARRNHDHLIACAIAEMTANPHVTMREIADASGLTRTTVYRHFPSRDNLLAGIYDHIEREAEAIVEEAIAHADVEDALHALATGVVAIGERYRFLALHATDQPGAARRSPDNPRLADYLLSARARGQIADDTPLRWQMAMIRGLATSACDELIHNSTSTHDAAARLTQALIAVLRL